VYDSIGLGYRRYRSPDPNIAARIVRALGDAKSVLNIGAGAGSYEPSDRTVVAVEPSEIMIRQRVDGSATCVQASAEALPFPSVSFDGAMAVLTVHHWARLEEGLREVRRVVRGKVVIVTWDPECHEDFWLTRDYLPKILEQDRSRFPKLATLAEQLGPIEVEPLPIPHDCIDGFRGAYWRRPQAYLDAEVRQSISSFAQLDDAVVTRAVAQLAVDLESGAWVRRNREILNWDSADLGYRIVTATCPGLSQTPQDTGCSESVPSSPRT